MKYALLLLLAGCSTGSGLYDIECVRPGASDNFVYRTAETYQLSESNVLTITEAENVYYYTVPEGSACRVQPMENSKTYEQEEH